MIIGRSEQSFAEASHQHSSLQSKREDKATTLYSTQLVSSIESVTVHWLVIVGLRMQQQLGCRFNNVGLFKHTSR